MSQPEPHPIDAPGMAGDRLADIHHAAEAVRDAAVAEAPARDAPGIAAKLRRALELADVADLTRGCPAWRLVRSALADLDSAPAAVP